MNKKKKKNLIILSSIIVTLLLLAYFGGFLQTVFYIGPLEVSPRYDYSYPEINSISFSGSKTSTNVESRAANGTHTILLSYKNTAVFGGDKWAKNKTLLNLCYSFKGTATGSNCLVNAGKLLNRDNWLLDTDNSHVKFNGVEYYADCNVDKPNDNRSFLNQYGYSCSGYNYYASTLSVNTFNVNETSGKLEFNLVFIPKSKIKTPIISSQQPTMPNITNGTTTTTPVICPANTNYNFNTKMCEYYPATVNSCLDGYIYNQSTGKCETSPQLVGKNNNLLYYIIGGIFIILISIILYFKFKGGKRRR